MLFDARTSVAPGATLYADVCIVGSGAAGITLALRLADKGLRVLVLEAGGETLSAPVQDAYRGTMSGIDTWLTAQMRLRYFGGSTNHWGGWCMPMERDDFLERSWIPLSGWPITLDDLTTYYRYASDVVEIGDSPWDVKVLAPMTSLEPWPSTREESTRKEATREEKLWETRVFKFSPPTRFATRFRRLLERAEDLSLFFHSAVTEVRLTPNLSRVDHLVVSISDGVTVEGTYRVQANRYVLALGGLENARLLLASNDQIPNGVANSSDFVGRCFMEHPHFYSSCGLVAPEELAFDFYTPKPLQGPSPRSDGTALWVQGVWAPTAEARRAHELLDFTIQLHPFPEAETGLLGPPTIAALFRRPTPALAQYVMTLRTEQGPDPDSRLTLSDERDALGMPRLDLRWLIERKQSEALHRAMVLAGAFFGGQGARLHFPTERSALDWTPLPGGHHMGTTRMTADPRVGVVDSNGRSFDLPNLYLAGSSVFTTGGSCNPTLTVVALAARLADHLLAS